MSGITRSVHRSLLYRGKITPAFFRTLHPNPFRKACRVFEKELNATRREGQPLVGVRYHPTKGYRIERKA